MFGFGGECSVLTMYLSVWKKKVIRILSVTHFFKHTSVILNPTVPDGPAEPKNHQRTTSQVVDGLVLVNLPALGIFLVCCVSTF